MHDVPASDRAATWILIGALAGLTGCASDSETTPEAEPEPPVITAAVPPPPISGGTLLVTEDDTVVAADADRDRVWIVDLSTRQLRNTVVLEPNDEPGRVVDDGAGRAFVALRGGAAVASIDIGTGAASRLPVCPSPRGLAFDPAFVGEDGSEPVAALHVGCVDGELMTIALTGEVLRSVQLPFDLRDVVINGEHLLVSRLRDAELLTVLKDGPGEVILAARPEPLVNRDREEFTPSTAWRAINVAGGQVAMLHQRAKSTPFEIETGAYTVGHCQSAVLHGTVTLFDPSGARKPLSMSYLPLAILPVDIAASSDGELFAVAVAGNSSIIRVQKKSFAATAECGFGGYVDGSKLGEDVPGQPVGIAFDSRDHIIVQTREPAAIYRLSPALKQGEGVAAPILLPGESRFDSGHELFHTNLGGKGVLACASCHVEGRDDGRVWQFLPMGPRRTQNLRGHILDTAPFHWDGDLGDMSALLDDTLVVRMGGAEVGPKHKAAVANWIDSMPPIPMRGIDADRAARGKALFEDSTVGCTRCHSGEKLTDNRSYDVGTGDAVQVPSLRGLSSRPPYMHTGCAPTLYERFTDHACGGGNRHGITEDLTEGEIDDLVGFLLSQ